jgi:chaperonin GroEL
LDGGLGKSGDEAAGVQIVAKSVVEPLRWIAENAGYEGYVAVARVAELPVGQGLNAATGEFEDLMEAGVVDPAKVVRTSLQNAASIASLLLTTEAVITDLPEEEKAPAGAGAPGGMGGMGGGMY